ncbi:MAG: methyltransferase [Actinobacteria bacterium 13_2_20CM_2_71_6]|nr:MAG: methyltransferase [Actinobacteria bacterium 13_2_20CM_2_71_6]
MADKDWHAWHSDYDLPGSVLAQRLAAVQDRIRAALDGFPPGPLTVVSLCAGQGRDLLGVLASHARRDDVTARLIELDPRNAGIATQAAKDAGLSQVEVRIGDAALVDHYADLVPADLVLVCGVFGNITDEDIRATVAACTQLCATAGTVVWTRHRRAPDLVPQICRWFEENGFELLSVSEPEEPFGVGAHRFAGEPRPLATGTRIFTFVP